MTTDLVIVGAGPAGLSAATEAAAQGLSVVLLDENDGPGGRIWQALESRGAMNAEDAAALTVIRQFRACGAAAHWGATVWAIEPDGTVFWSRQCAAHATRSRYVLLATGATERPLPVACWTLPGVMTVGAAQIALKTGGLVPDANTWIAGQGPLLLLYTVQALRAGGRIGGILDLSDPAARWRAGRHLPAAALRFGGDLWKGLRWRQEIRRAGIQWLRASDLRADGDGRLQRIRFRTAGGMREEAADLLLLHDGVIPSMQIPRAAGCPQEWNHAQHCWQPVTDPWGATSIPGMFVAGDGGGIRGAEAARASGRIAALGIAHACGKISARTRDEAAASPRATLARLASLRGFLDHLYPPLPIRLKDATLVCRCEEVSAGQIRRAATLGCRGLNQLKAYTRCGMGPCQGRMCGTTAAEVLAEVHGVPVGEVEPFRARFPTKPLVVGELAALEQMAEHR